MGSFLEPQDNASQAEELVHVGYKENNKNGTKEEAAKELELEMDDHNSNICMRTMLATIDYLTSPSFTELSDAPSESQKKKTAKAHNKEMPKWMAFMHSKMSSPGWPSALPSLFFGSLIFFSFSFFY